jgi:hypothetical protein
MNPWFRRRGDLAVYRLSIAGLRFALEWADLRGHDSITPFGENAQQRPPIREG